LSSGVTGVPALLEVARSHGISLGSISPTLFEDQDYKFGSLGNPDPLIREKATQHLLDSAEIARQTGSRDITPWFADGSNYPGTCNMRRRRGWFRDGLRRLHDSLAPKQRILVEYKPFEPAFYHTDIADWGMALLLARDAGPQARVLVDIGHHYHAQNIEQIVAWLLDEEMLGGFHFNDRCYADDDLTVGSIDPYRVFRIFHEILFYRWERGANPDISYMIDQNHNLKPKIDEMIQTVTTVQELVAKAALVDYEKLCLRQSQSDLIGAEECLKRAFHTDVLPWLREWRKARGLAADPLEAFRESGYRERVIAEGRDLLV